MGLDPGELAERSVVRVVAPDLRTRRDHRVLARGYPGVVGVPDTGVDDDVVAHRCVLHVLADRVDDAGRVGAADVEVLALAALLPCGDLVDRVSAGRPHVVVVDAGRHDGNQDLARPDLRGLDDLGAEGPGGVA
jgi:hypothetical protein